MQFQKRLYVVLCLTFNWQNMDISRSGFVKDVIGAIKKNVFAKSLVAFKTVLILFYYAALQQKFLLTSFSSDIVECHHSKRGKILLLFDLFAFNFCRRKV